MQDVEEPPLSNDVAMRDWLDNIKAKRLQLVGDRDDRRRRRIDMTKRRTQASQQRMRIITELAQGRKSKKDDTFGMKDEDWDVYKEIVRVLFILFSQGNPLPCPA